MADDTQNLNVTISAQDNGATAVLIDVRSKISAIEQELSTLQNTGGAALDGLASKGGNVGGMFKSLHDSSTGLGGALDEVTQHSYLLSRGLDAAGLASGAAAVRVGAFSDALRGLVAANPEILAIVAAIAAVVGAFEFLKGAVTEASAVQDAMEELRIAIEQNGGSWAAAKPKIDAWAQALAVATGITETTSVPAIERLVAAGQHVSGALSLATIAADAAAAGMGRMRGGTESASTESERFNLNLRALQESTTGHVEALEQIDNKLTPLVDLYNKASDKGAAYHAILVQLNADTADAVVKNDSLTSAWGHVQGELSVIAEAAGEQLLPALTQVAKGAFVVVDAIAHLGGAFSEWAGATVTLVTSAAKGVWSAFNLVLDINKDLAEALKNIGVAAFQTFMQGANEALQGVEKGFGDFVSALGPFGDAIKNTLKAASDDFTTWAGNALTSITSVMKGMAESSGLASIYQNATSALEGKGPWANPLGDWGLPKNVTSDVDGLRDAVNGVGKAAGQTASGVKDTWSAISNAGKNATADLNHANAVLKAIAAQGLADVQQFGSKTAKGGGSGYTPPVIADETQQHKLNTAAEQENETVTNALADAKDRAAGIEATLTANVKAATSMAAEQAAQAALDAQKITDLATQHTILNNAVYDEKRAMDADSAAQTTAKAAYESALTTLRNWTQAHANAKDMSEQEKEKLVILKGAVTATKAALDDATSAVKTSENAWRSHKEALAQDAAQQLELASAARDAAAEAMRSWGTYFTDQQTKLHDDLATFTMTNQEKVSYYGTSLADQLSLAQANYAKLQELYQEDLAAKKANDTAKIASTQQAMAQIGAAIEQEYNLAKEYDDSELSSYKSMLQQELDAKKAELAQEQSITATVLDDLLDQHKTFAATVKEIFDGLLKDYITDMSKMLVATPGFQKIATAFGGAPGLSGINQQAQGQMQQAAAQMQTAATTQTSAATNQATAATNQTTASTQQTNAGTTQTTAAKSQVDAAQTQLKAANTILDAANRQALGQGGAGGLVPTGGTYGAPSPIGGSYPALPANMYGPGSLPPDTIPTSYGSAIITYLAGTNAPELTSEYQQYGPNAAVNTPVPISGFGGAGGVIPGMPFLNVGSGFPGAPSSDNGQPQTGFAAMGWGGALQAGLMGYGVGSNIEGMEYPGQLPGQDFSGGIGGAIGGILGTGFGGPIGGFLGDILGGLIGGLFGPHETAAQEPDVSEPTYGTQWNYGQFVSNMIGTYGTYNGQYYGAQQPYNISEGGTSMASQVAAALKDLPTTLSPALESLSSQLKALEDGDQNPNALAIKSEYQGEFTLMSGATVGVQQYMQMINSFMNQTAGMVPTFELTRAYPNFNQSTLTATGEYLPTVNVGTGAQGIPPGTTQPIPGTPTVPSSEQSQQSMAQRPIYVTVKINGPVIGGGQIPQEVAQEIAQALQRLQIGTAAGGFGNRMGTGTGGGDF